MLVHKIIVRCLMGKDFYKNHVDELYSLLHVMEADIAHLFNFVLPAWMPHLPARRLGRARDRVGKIFKERLAEREKNPDVWKNSHDYISYTMQDRATSHLKDLYPAHHTILMFASHTSTVSNISWTIVEVSRCFMILPIVL